MNPKRNRSATVTSLKFLLVWLSVLLGGASVDSILAQGMAEGGSPLYSLAVRESIDGLGRRGDAESREPPAGEVCPNCGKIHTVAEAQATNLVAQAQAAAPSVEGQVCPVCRQVHAVGASQAIGTNQTAGASASRVSINSAAGGIYYYCENCKVYHLRPRAPALTPSVLDEALQQGEHPPTNALPVADNRTSNVQP